VYFQLIFTKPEATIINKIKQTPYHTNKAPNLMAKRLLNLKWYEQGNK
jgi:hypothetical protein